LPLLLLQQGIDSVQSMPGALKSLKIRAQGGLSDIFGSFRRRLAVELAATFI
jgi:hypothetical protein